MTVCVNKSLHACTFTTRTLLVYLSKKKQKKKLRKNSYPWAMCQLLDFMLQVKHSYILRKKMIMSVMCCNHITAAVCLRACLSNTDVTVIKIPLSYTHTALLLLLLLLRVCLSDFCGAVSFNTVITTLKDVLLYSLLFSMIERFAGLSITIIMTTRIWYFYVW